MRWAIDMFYVRRAYVYLVWGSKWCTNQYFVQNHLQIFNFSMVHGRIGVTLILSLIIFFLEGFGECFSFVKWGLTENLLVVLILFSFLLNFVYFYFCVVWVWRPYDVFVRILFLSIPICGCSSPIFLEFNCWTVT